MNEHADNLSRTRADRLGTDDEEHYGHCHDAAADIERLSAEVETKELARKAALKTIDSLTARKATLSAENTALKKVADAAREVMDIENDKGEAMHRIFADWNDWFERASTEHKQACDRSHDKLKGAYEGLADTEQTDVCPETAIEKDNQKRDGDRQTHG